MKESEGTATRGGACGAREDGTHLGAAVVDIAVLLVAVAKHDVPRRALHRASNPLCRCRERRVKVGEGDNCHVVLKDRWSPCLGDESAPPAVTRKETRPTRGTRACG